MQFIAVGIFWGYTTDATSGHPGKETMSILMDKGSIGLDLDLFGGVEGV